MLLISSPFVTSCCSSSPDKPPRTISPGAVHRIHHPVKARGKEGGRGSGLSAARLSIDYTGFWIVSEMPCWSRYAASLVQLLCMSGSPRRHLRRSITADGEGRGWGRAPRPLVYSPIIRPSIYSFIVEVSCHGDERPTARHANPEVVRRRHAPRPSLSSPTHPSLNPSPPPPPPPSPCSCFLHGPPPFVNGPVNAFLGPSLSL